MYNKNDAEYFDVYPTADSKECLTCRVIDFHGVPTFEALAFYGFNKEGEYTLIKCKSQRYFPLVAVSEFEDSTVSLDEAEPFENSADYEELEERRRIVPIKIKLNGNAKVPEYSNPTDTGADIYAANSEVIRISCGEHKLIPTGIQVDLPEGYGIQIRPRSGLALKKGVTVLNTPGTIDNKYKDEIGVVLINNGSEHFYVNPGDRIAQMVVEPIYKAEFKIVNEIDKTDDRNGGFGHTGTN